MSLLLEVAPQNPPDESDGSWWSNSLNRVAILTAASLVAVNSLCAQLPYAKNAQQDEPTSPVPSGSYAAGLSSPRQGIRPFVRVFIADDEITLSIVPNVVSDDDQWAVSAPAASVYTQSRPWVFGQSEDAVSLFGQPDEDFWINPVLPVQQTFIVPTSALWEPHENASGLYGQLDEDYWVNSVAPVGLSFLVPDPARFESNETAGLAGQPSEDYWQNSVAPVQLTFRLFDQSTQEQHEQATGLYGQLDTDSWAAPVIWPTATSLPKIADDEIVTVVIGSIVEDEGWSPPAPMAGLVLPVRASIQREDDGIVANQSSNSYGGALRGPRSGSRTYVKIYLGDEEAVPQPIGGSGFASAILGRQGRFIRRWSVDDEVVSPLLINESDWLPPPPQPLVKPPVRALVFDEEIVPQPIPLFGDTGDGRVPIMVTAVFPPVVAYVADDDIAQTPIPIHVDEEYWAVSSPQKPVLPPIRPVTADDEITQVPVPLGIDDSDYVVVRPQTSQPIVLAQFADDDYKPVTADDSEGFTAIIVGGTATLPIRAITADDELVRLLNVEDDYWTVLPPQKPVLPPLQATSADDEIVPQSVPLGIDEFYWQNPVASVPASLAWPQPWVFDQNEVSGTLGAAPADEVYWQNPVAPVASTLQWPQQFGFEQLESATGLFNFSTFDDGEWPSVTVVAPTQLGFNQPRVWEFEQNEPASNLFGQLDEDYWTNSVAPISVTFRQPNSWTLEQDDPAGALSGQLDEDYWVNWVAPVSQSFKRLDAWFFDQNEPARSQPDEDYWINSVRPVVSAFRALNPAAFEQFESSNLYGQPDEDIYLPPAPWKIPVCRAYYYDAGDKSWAYGNWNYANLNTGNDSITPLMTGTGDSINPQDGNNASIKPVINLEDTGI